MSTNPNVAILDQAWAMLWEPTSDYYLPTILQKGGTFGKTTIPAMATVAVSDITAIPLYSSDTWGDVSIDLTSLQLSGLPSIQNGSFTPASDASSISAVVAFGSLTFSGSYEVTGSGLAGCAMDMAGSQAGGGGPIPPETGDAAGVEDDGPTNMDLARQYRDQLVQQSGANGTTMVSTYYDHNDTMNYILNRSNAFTLAWPTEATNDKTTRDFMQQTNAAAQNPKDQNYQIGDDDYNSHAMMMQNVLISTSFGYADSPTDPENPFVALATDTAAFRGNTIPYQQPSTVGTVMDTVQNATPLTTAQLATMEESPLARAARIRGERVFAKWDAVAKAREAARIEQATTYKSSGDFSFTFGMPTLTWSGTVAISGMQPLETMTVTVTTLTANVPNVTINLLTGTDQAFTSDAQSQINDATWFQKTIGTKVNAELGSASVLSYFSGVINQALISILTSDAA